MNISDEEQADMSYPFRIGGVYRNRQNEYEVISINEPKMTVRFRDGKELTGNIADFARIWENIEAGLTGNPFLDDDDERHSKPAPSQAPRKPASPSKRRSNFAGLKDSDFKRNVKDTSWRSQESLGGLLAKELSAELGVAFKSWPIDYQGRVFFAHEEFQEMNKRDVGTHLAKLYFSVDPDEARVGFLIERSDEAMDETWDWPRFIERLGAGIGLETVVATMQTQGAQGEVRLTLANRKEVEGGELRAVDGKLMWREPNQEESIVSWRECAQRLEDAEPGVWSDLYFYVSFQKDEAIRLGVGIADRAVQVFRALYPLYRMAQR